MLIIAIMMLSRTRESLSPKVTFHGAAVVDEDDLLEQLLGRAVDHRDDRPEQRRPVLLEERDDHAHRRQHRAVTLLLAPGGTERRLRRNAEALSRVGRGRPGGFVRGPRGLD